MESLDNYIVEIDGKTYEQIRDRVAEVLKQKLKEDRGAFDDLKKAAQKFVQAYKDYSIGNFNDIAQKLNNRKNQLKSLYKKTSASEDELREKVEEGMEKYGYKSSGGDFISAKYQDSIDGKEEILEKSLAKKEVMKFFKAQYVYLNEVQKILGTQMNFVMVSENSGRIFEESLENLLKRDFNELFSVGFGSQGKGIQLSMKGVFSDKQQKKARYKEKDLSLIKHAQDLLEIYREVIDRSNYSKEVAKGLGKSNSLVLWRPSGMRYWQKAFVSSQGDIAEAYAGYMYALETGVIKDDFFRGTMEDKIDVFMTGGVGIKRYRNKEKITFGDFRGIGGVLGVDSMKGTYRGDVSNGNQQYAIKTASTASLQGYEEDVKVATKIANGSVDDIITAISEDYAKSADNPGVHNSIKQDANKKVKDTMKTMTGKDMIKYEKRKTKISLTKNS